MSHGEHVGQSYVLGAVTVPAPGGRLRRLAGCPLALTSLPRSFRYYFFFFNDTATTEIYTLSLHDALPISPSPGTCAPTTSAPCSAAAGWRDRKSTRLNSSHVKTSYAVFCLKKKKKL